MKKLFLISGMLLSSILVSAQLKVFSTGQTLFGSTTNSMTGNFQFNLTPGTNNGITLNNTPLNQIYRLVFDDYTWAFNNNINDSQFGFYGGGFYFGHSYFAGNYAMSSVNIMPRWTGTNYGTCALYVGSPFADGTASTLSRNTSSSSGGVSVASIVNNNAGVTFASAKSSSSYNFNYNFYVLGNGEIYAQNIHLPSASTLGTSPRSISSSLDKILQLRGVEYEIKEDVTTVSQDYTLEERRSAQEIQQDSVVREDNVVLPKLNPAVLQQIENEQARSKRLGFVAQEVEQVLPNVVHTSLDGTKSISYLDLIVLLVESVKEQQIIIADLQSQISNLNSENLSQRNMAPHKNESATIIEQAVLYQNNPNPFTQDTRINYLLPQTTLNATLYIYNMNGSQVAEYPVSSFGEGCVIVSANALDAGMYLYSLIADGHVIDTKRMILTK